ncbi:MAG: V-type ATP synthase subunit D, partial [Candidatus Omnitrophica bacterium]|nr:V-type ATP synthase subunit D [Candidatus Omnitrophota bacterium]
AERGYELLEDKLEEMMRRFGVLLKEIHKIKEDFQQKHNSLLKHLLYFRITTAKSDFQEAISKISTKCALNIEIKRILNVRVPVFQIKELGIEKHYDLFKTSGDLDLAIKDAGEYLRSLVKLAELIKTLDILSYEIERTRRRVNALEYVLIPSIQQTMRYIMQKLNEFERGNLVRLMRIKEIVRSH